MRNCAGCTVFDPLLSIPKIPTAPFTECIKRAVTKQTIKMFRIDTLVTGKEFAFPVAEKFIVFGFFLVHHERL